MKRSGREKGELRRRVKSLAKQITVPRRGWFPNRGFLSTGNEFVSSFIFWRHSVLVSFLFLRACSRVSALVYLIAFTQE